MPVPVMDVREVRVRVGERLVRVLVSMRLARIDARRMRVPVVRVMDVAMRVGQPLVRVRVLVALGEMEPHSHAHKPRGGEKQDEYAYQMNRPLYWNCRP